MTGGIVRWIRKWWIWLVTTVIFISVIFYFYNDKVSRIRYEEKAVMAKEYLEAGNYEEAQEAYLEALSMDYGDKELLSIGLAEAYAGMHEYDKALEVLRNRYEAEKSTAIKEKIEEITVKKTDYIYYQLISYGDTYFSNGEYSKAVDEYEKAKLIKSKADTTYIRIVESYMAMERYDLASEEIQAGLALTDSEKLKRLQEKVEERLNEIKYEEILAKAAEYIYQENYEEALNSLNEAIRLIPRKDSAYNRMAEVYITLKEYNTAKGLLQNYLRSNSSTETQDLLGKINDLIRKEEEKTKLLNELYTALSVADIESITSIMQNPTYTDIISEEGTPYYYNPSGKTDLTMGYGLVIYDNNQLYVGGFKNGMRGGIGMQFVWYGEKDMVWYYYQGEWNNDLPNGMGKTVEEGYRTDNEGHITLVTTVTTGMFAYGLENGMMTKTFQTDGVKKKVTYMTSEGIPEIYVDENSMPVKSDLPGHYVIGRMYMDNEPIDEYYSVRQGTKLKVKFLGNK